MISIPGKSAWNANKPEYDEEYIGAKAWMNVMSKLDQSRAERMLAIQVLTPAPKTVSS